MAQVNNLLVFRAIALPLRLLASRPSAPAWAAPALTWLLALGSIAFTFGWVLTVHVAEPNEGAGRPGGSEGWSRKISAPLFFVLPPLLLRLRTFFAPLRFEPPSPPLDDGTAGDACARYLRACAQPAIALRVLAAAALLAIHVPDVAGGGMLDSYLFASSLGLGGVIAVELFLSLVTTAAIGHLVPLRETALSRIGDCSLICLVTHVLPSLTPTVHSHAARFRSARC